MVRPVEAWHWHVSEQEIEDQKPFIQILPPISKLEGHFGLFVYLAKRHHKPTSSSSLVGYCSSPWWIVAKVWPSFILLLVCLRPSISNERYLWCCRFWTFGNDECHGFRATFTKLHLTREGIGTFIYCTWCTIPLENCIFFKCNRMLGSMAKFVNVCMEPRLKTMRVLSFSKFTCLQGVLQSMFACSWLAQSGTASFVEGDLFTVALFWEAHSTKVSQWTKWQSLRDLLATLSFTVTAVTF